MRSRERGITLVEIIIVVALMFVVLPFAWDYINGAVQDQANVTNKNIVQTSVTQLMNNMQQQVQEASFPIMEKEDVGGLRGSAKTEESEGAGGSITLNKPDGVTAKYTYDEETATVSYELKDKVQLIDSAEYGNISEFTVIPVLTEKDDGTKPINGLNITIVGRIDDKSSYSLTNEYYTRNTI